MAFSNEASARNWVYSHFKAPNNTAIYLCPFCGKWHCSTHKTEYDKEKQLTIMTHASLFSGIGGAELAAAWMGWQNLFHCEINPFGRKVLEYWFPNSIAYDDITQTDFTPWHGRVDVLTGGFPCFVSGTPVLTSEGFLPIDEVRAGDNVLAADGNYHPVDATMEHEADEIVYLRAQGMFEELKCTPNHPFYVRRKEIRYEHRAAKAEWLPPCFIPVSEIKIGDKIGYPVHNGKDASYTPAFWKLIGAWLADGWCYGGRRKSDIPQGHRGSRINSFNHKVIICCGKNNLARLHHIISKAGFKYTLSEEKSTYKCIICNERLCDFLQAFGKYAFGKHLSPQCYKLDNDRKEALLEGWFADGYTDKNGSVKVTTVSKELVMGMAQLSRDVYRRPVSISRKTVNRTCVIEGRTVNERTQYCLTIPNSSRYGFYEDGVVWCNVKKIRREKENNTVFNLSVKDEHTYTAYGVVVHNCQPFSLAGRRKGAEDDRYLWPQMLRAIREIHPSWVVGENVAGLTTMVQPGETADMGRSGNLFEENHLYRTTARYTLDEILASLEDAGYTVQPFLIPACAVGAPHRRDRLWIVAHRTDAGTENKPARTVQPHTARPAADTLRRGRDERGGDIQPQLTDGQGAEGDGTQRDAANPGGTGLERAEGQAMRCEERAAAAQCRAGLGEGHPAHKPNGAERLDTQRDDDGEPDAPQQAQRRELQPLGADCPQDWWRQFPSVPPVCRGNDGLPFDMARLTIPEPRWRKEAIKAMGNAFVPQVLYEIFKAIQQEYD